MTGERLTRDEALDLVRRAVTGLTNGEDVAVPAAEVRRKARELLGRDSESLSERFFNRILSDAHDANVVDLRKHGDGYEVAQVLADPANVTADLGGKLRTSEMTGKEAEEVADFLSKYSGKSD